MARKRKTLETSLPWHVDCRLTEELPEDNLVRRSFIATAATGSLATLLFLLGWWLNYLGRSYENDTAYWDQRIAAAHDEGEHLRAFQRNLVRESQKIDRAYALMRPPYVVHQLVQQLARTRPERVTISRIESNETGIVIRGGLTEPSERASRLMGSYVETLRAHPAIGPLFREITLTGLDRGDSTAHLSFEIVLKLKPPAP
jgi:hypothetical protein